MSRRHSAETRKVLPDAKFGNVTVTKLINYLMEGGKKSVAEAIVYNSFDLLAKQTKNDPLQSFSEALDVIRPTVEVRSRRVGGATYQVPVEVRQNRSVALALRWIIDAARKRKEKTMQQRLAAELIDALNKRGSALKKREDTHKMAEANKAFAHFRW
ncbi:MAG TPA: 30S ribosomal protein S7 [Alphaproteobacteria bacterium]|nr:30S ribosomal protein S7 [Alphaproteobacteria bacterium]